MSSNFSGNVRKNSKSFVPRNNGGEDVVVEKTAAGGYGQGGVQYFEPAKKAADEPVLSTTATPRTDGKGESELNLSGRVTHDDRDGGAQYLASRIAREYRQILARVGGVENISLAQRRQMRDELVERMGDGGYGQDDAADSTGGRDTRASVWELATLLFGLIDELTPSFHVERADSGTLIKSAGSSVSVFCRILHKDAALREVHGVIAEEAPDKASEILDYSSSEPYFRKWSAEAYERTSAAGLPASYGNVREQHSPRAVGLLKDIKFDAVNKRIPVVAKIVDDETWRKIQAGVLTGFSIGGSYLNKWADGDYIRYTAKPAEVSIVDNPCMPGATFSMVKDAPTDLEKIKADLRKTAEALTKRLKEMLEAQGANLEELSPTRFKTMAAWREAIAKAELKKSLANGKPASQAGEGDRTTSSFKTLGTGEAPSGTAKKHYSEIERKPFQPRS